MSGSYRIFPPGHPLELYDGNLDPLKDRKLPVSEPQLEALRLARVVSTFVSPVAAQQGFDTRLASGILGLGVAAFSLADDIPPQFLEVMSVNDPKLNAARQIQLPDANTYDPNTCAYLFGTLRHLALELLHKSKANPVHAIQAAFFFEAYQLNNLRAMRRGKRSRGVDMRTLNAERLRNNLNDNYRDASPATTRQSIDLVRTLLASIPTQGQGIVYLKSQDQDGDFVDAESFGALENRRKIQIYISYLEAHCPYYWQSNFYRLLQCTDTAYRLSDQMLTDLLSANAYLTPGQSMSHADQMMADFAEQIRHSANRMYLTVECLANNQPHNLLQFDDIEK